MADTVTFTNPAQNYAGTGTSAAVPVTYVGIEAEFGAISSFTFHIESSIVAQYGLETSDAGPQIILDSNITEADRQVLDAALTRAR